MKKENEKLKDKKLFTNLITVLIVFTIIYAILLFMTGLNIINNKYCNSIQISDYKGKETYNGFVLDNTNEYVLQNFNVNNTEINLAYKFCFETNITSNKGGVKANIINQEKTILGIIYLKEGLNYDCLSFREDDKEDTKIKQNNYLGISCIDCDSNNKIYLRQELAGKDVKQIYYNGIENIYENDTINYNFISEQSCKTNFKMWTKYYLIILFSIALMMLIFLGWNKIHKLLYEDFLDEI
jgi:competence protein ComGC